MATNISPRRTIETSLTQAMREEFRLSILWGGTVAEEVGLHLTDMITVMYLREKGSATAGELAEITGRTTGAMTAAINRLVRAGLVKRTHDVTDKRKVIVRLTGIPKRFRSLGNSASKDMARLFSKYSELELEKMIAFKQEINAIITKTIHRFKK